MLGVPKRRARSLAALAVLLGLACGTSPAAARQWKATPKALALDYAQIIDHRSTRDSVVIWWLVPPMLEHASVEAQELLDKYVIIGVVRAHSQIGGTMSF